MLKNVIREVSPLAMGDCFLVTSRTMKKADIPVHNHEEIELSLVINARGAKRIVGNHTGEAEEKELLLVGTNLPHGWLNHHCQSEEIQEIRLHIQPDLLDEKLLGRNQLTDIRIMLERAKQGILFSMATTEEIALKLEALSTQSGFSSLLSLLAILHDLSVVTDTRMLSDASFPNEKYRDHSRRIEQVFEYMHANFRSQVTLADVSRIANMPEASFSRYIKKKTGHTFIDHLNEIRLSHVSKLLTENTDAIADIALTCGFNNMANFNRTFKRMKGCTPKEFRRKPLATY
jgi:AraC-like DNA-binding protein